MQNSNKKIKGHKYLLEVSECAKQTYFTSHGHLKYMQLMIEEHAYMLLFELDLHFKPIII